MEIRNQGDKKSVLFMSMTWSRTEERYSPEEKHLALAFRFYPVLREMSQGTKKCIYTIYPSISEATKQTVQGAKVDGENGR